jgi:hypothetical protein
VSCSSGSCACSPRCAGEEAVHVHVHVHDIGRPRGRVSPSAPGNWEMHPSASCTSPPALGRCSARARAVRLARTSAASRSRRCAASSRSPPSGSVLRGAAPARQGEEPRRSRRARERSRRSSRRRNGRTAPGSCTGARGRRATGIPLVSRRRAATRAGGSTAARSVSGRSAACCSSSSTTTAASS